MEEKSPHISVVIPAYNEETRIAATLRATVEFLKSSGLSFEVLVVDDGSSDSTVNVVEQLASELPGVRCLRNPRNLGKGAAVKNGVFSSRGRFVAFLDADNSTRIADLDRLIGAVSKGAAIAVGSRAHRYSVIPVKQRGVRQMAGKVFNLLCRTLLGINVSDSQCGFKLFTSRAARKIFSISRIGGFCFDVEILFIARKKGLRIAEIPVTWSDNRESKVRLFKDSLGMFLGLLEIKLNDRRRLYQ